MTFVDIGVNVGLYTAMALSIANASSAILCIEPHDENRDYLKETIAANNHACRLVVSNKAVSDHEGEGTLYKNSQNKGDNRLCKDILLDDSEIITVTTLDTICANNKIESIDFLKIDIQGGEGKALAGANSILHNSKDCIILSELWPHGLSRFGSDATSYLDSLSQLGFTLFELGKKAALTLVNRDQIIKSTQGRRYKNIVGFKGKYLALIQS